MLITLLSSALAQSPPAADPCPYDQAAMMSQSVRDFDQTPSGWRSVAKTPGCEAGAADLIKAYRRANWAAHRPAEIHTSYWHEGQMRAAAGQDRAAIPLLMAGVNPYPLQGDDLYAQGTIAFLNRDRRGLEEPRARLAALPPPEDWNQMQMAAATHSVEISWPPNLDVLDRLLTCFDQPYREAYGACSTVTAEPAAGRH